MHLRCGNVIFILGKYNFLLCKSLLFSLLVLAFVGQDCNCNELIAEECVQDTGAISGTVLLGQMVVHG